MVREVVLLKALQKKNHLSYAGLAAVLERVDIRIPRRTLQDLLTNHARDPYDRTREKLRVALRRLARAPSRFGLKGPVRVRLAFMILSLLTEAGGRCHGF